MRKFMYAALAGVFMLSPLTVTNAQSIMEQPQQANCVITITRTSIDSNGNATIESRTHYYNAADEADCNFIGQQTLNMYRSGALTF